METEDFEIKSVSMSSPSSLARIVLKVGLDQWIVVDKNKGIDLYTDGLSGCVAVVLMSERHVFLAHVSSAARKERAHLGFG